MNANGTIFVLALASNFNPEQHFKTAYRVLNDLGHAVFSNIYLIPCRDHIGEDYWNAACLLSSTQPRSSIEAIIKTLEADSGRIRPSHSISLDVDLIAWGSDLEKMQFNPKKLPLALDVKIPLYELWQHSDFKVEDNIFSIVDLKYSMST